MIIEFTVAIDPSFGLIFDTIVISKSFELHDSEIQFLIVSTNLTTFSFTFSFPILLFLSYIEKFNIIWLR
nr:MAG TPA: hypothetical protein [Caudoviricetes sp.]